MSWFLIQQFVLLLITAAIFAVFGWWLRAKFAKMGATRAEVDAERGKTQGLEDRARKAEAERAAAATELAALKSSSVAASDFAAAKKALADEQTKSDSLQTQLKKARELQIASEARNNDAGKGSQAKVFQLENELAGLREQAARDRQAAQDAAVQVQEFKSAVPGKPEEMVALEKELMQARRAFTASENNAAEAKRGRDMADIEATKLRDKMKMLDSELAVARGKAAPGAVKAVGDDASTLRIALAAAESKAADALRSVSIARDEAFNLRAKVGLLEAELDEAKGAIQAPATEGDIEHVRNSLHASQAEADASKHAHNLAAAQVVVLRTEVSALKAQLDKLHADHGTVATPAANIATSPSAPPAIPAPVAAEEPEATGPGTEAPPLEGEAGLPPVA